MVGSVLRGLSLNPQMNRSYEPAIRLMVMVVVKAEKSVLVEEKKEKYEGFDLRRVLYWVLGGGLREGKDFYFYFIFLAATLREGSLFKLQMYPPKLHFGVA